MGVIKLVMLIDTEHRGTHNLHRLYQMTNDFVSEIEDSESTLNVQGFSIGYEGNAK